MEAVILFGILMLLVGKLLQHLSKRTLVVGVALVFIITILLRYEIMNCSQSPERFDKCLIKMGIEDIHKARKHPYRNG